MTGWRNNDFEPRDEAPLTGAWFMGIAILAVLVIVTFVLIAAGVIIHTTT